MFVSGHRVRPSTFFKRLATEMYEDVSSWDTSPFDRFEYHPQDVFDPVHHPVYQIPDLQKIDRKVLGASMMVLGTGMLVPGPLDIAAAAVGAAIGGPWGAVAGVAIYNITAVGLVVVGFMFVAY